ncbi:MAG TPA: cyclodeaminase/cyclohydrolase family protein [Candidatus Dormibacteraeota bacterium]|nr:cyclodeaminase/cyclohydrolase family protein [Candidatus Dormibacteraeota bacterium]
MPSAGWRSATTERQEARLESLLNGLASDQPVPAGGSATAAVVAVAAALLEKAAKLSAAHWTGAAGARERAHALRVQAEELLEEDSHAYMAFVEAVRGAKGTIGEARERAIGPAHSKTVDVPLAIVRSGAEAVDLAAQLATHGNPNLRADAVVAATLAAAAAEAAASLMAVNLSAKQGDPRLAEARRLATAAGRRAADLRT